jgi:hypothetical protein
MQKFFFLLFLTEKINSSDLLRRIQEQFSGRTVPFHFPLEMNGRFERKKKKSPVGATEDGGSSIVRTSFQVENFTFT